MANQVNRPRLPRFESLPWHIGIWLTLGLTFILELLRQSGLLLPTPFLLLIVATALNASFGGLRAGLSSAVICGGYFIYAAQVPSAPRVLTFGLLQALIGSSIITLLALLQGREKDQNDRLTQKLQTIRDSLEQQVKARTADLMATNEQLRHEICDRIQIEAQLKYRIAFDQLVADISTRFITLSDRDISVAIDQALRAVGQFTQVDTSYLFLFSSDQTTLSLVHEWVAPGNPSQIDRAQPMPCSMFPKSVADLLRGELVCVKDVADLPDDFAVDQAGWLALNLHSVLTVPLVAQHHVLGGVSFASFHKETPWSDSCIQLIETFSQILSNVLQRQQTESVLLKSEERWQLALQNDGLFDLDLQANEVFYSARWKAMLGYAEDEISNQNSEWWDRIHPDDLERIIAAEWTFRTGAMPYFEQEYRLRCKDGSYKWILGRGHALYDDSGHAIRLVGSHTDISDRKQAEAALRQSEQRFQAIFNQTFQFMGLMTPDGTLIEANQTALNYGDLQREEVINQLLWKTYWWKSSPETQAQLKQAVADASQGKFIRYEVDVCGSHHQVVTIDFSLQPIRDDHSQIVLLLLEGQDISELKRAEAQLRQVNTQLEARVQERTAALQASEQRYRSLYNNTPVMMHSIDSKGRLVRVSDFWLEKMGYTRAEVLHRQSTDFLTDACRQQAIEVTLPLFFKTGYCQEVPYQFVTKTGKVIDVLMSATAERNAAGELVRSLAVIIDVTERAAIERMKEEFISAVSHELRTPLTAMHGALDLLSTGLTPPASEQGQHVIEIAAQHSHRLVGLVNDILELERLESGNLNLNHTWLNTVELTQRAMAFAQMQADQAGVKLELSDPGFDLFADGERLMQVLINLLNNGIKFTEPVNRVQIIVECLSEPPPEQSGLAPTPPSPWVFAPQAPAPPRLGPAILFKVQDSGRGIPADQLDIIFERFYQVDTSDARQKGGTGLGLAICRSIVQQHGGHIWVNSELGQGSCFYFTVPQGKDAPLKSPSF